MQTNIAGASGKVNYFQADLILPNYSVHSQTLPLISSAPQAEAPAGYIPTAVV